METDGATNSTIKAIHSKNEVATVTDTAYGQSELTLISEYKRMRT
jgi:hypothetical protein